MDLENTTGAAIVRHHAGRTYRFPRLHMGHLGDLLAELREEKRVQLLADLESVKAGVKERIAALRELDDRAMNTVDGMRWARTPRGCERALLISLQIDRPDAAIADVHALPFDPLDLMLIAVNLWGFEVRTDETGEGRGDDAGPLARMPETQKKMPSTGA